MTSRIVLKLTDGICELIIAFPQSHQVSSCDDNESYIIQSGRQTEPLAAMELSFRLRYILRYQCIPTRYALPTNVSKPLLLTYVMCMITFNIN